MNNILSTPITKINFMFFDTETTGANVKREDKPIELALIHWNMINGILEKPKSWLFNPGIPIHPSAIPIHGLQDEDVENSPTLEETLPEINEELKDHVLVAHNIDFDLAMIPTFKDVPNIKIDSLRFVKQIYKKGDLGYKNQELYSHKMQELRYWLNLKVDTNGEQAHRATADILVTLEVFSETLKRFVALNNIDADKLTLQDLIDFTNAPILTDKMSFGKFKDRLISDAIAEEKNNPKNYFKWLFSSIHKKSMDIDPDMKYSIEYYLKKAGIDPAIYMVDDDFKKWSKK